LLTLGAAVLLSACQALPPVEAPAMDELLAVDLVLLGEQHDAAEHQALERRTVAFLAARGRLAAVAMEMAEQGRSTRGLDAGASEAQVREALAWDDRGWPWAAYGPVVMTAVRAGVPVLGANLPREQMRAAMRDEALDATLPAPALARQREAIRVGHCDLLPASQHAPMTRIQIARDRRMAETLVAAAQPGRVVLLIAGAAHVERDLGVPLHLPPQLRTQVVQMRAGDAPTRAADRVWSTPAVPPRDYCEGLRR
jgi:uncharacterized iron-regulated protein